MTEKELQAACEEILKADGVRYLHKNNSPRQRTRKGTNCTMTGLPDLVIFYPAGRTVFVELKVGTGLRESQVEYIDYLADNGHSVFVVHSLEQFENINNRFSSRLGGLPPKVPTYLETREAK